MSQKRKRKNKIMKRRAKIYLSKRKAKKEKMSMTKIP